MSVEIRPTPIWAHSMIATIAQIANTVAPSHNKADLWAEWNQWLQLCSTTRDTRDWYKPRHYPVGITAEATEVSSSTWGGVVNRQHMHRSPTPT